MYTPEFHIIDCAFEMVGNIISASLQYEIFPRDKITPFIAH